MSEAEVPVSAPEARLLKALEAQDKSARETALRDGWWAAVAVTAPLESHRLPDIPVRIEGGATVALCGRAHKGWRRVEEFVRPSALVPCAHCRRLEERDV